MSSFVLERLFLGSGAGFLFALLWEWATCRLFNWNHLVRKKGLHFHHSLMGPGAWLILPHLFDMSNILAFSIGLGVVLQHTWNEGFIFISKINSDANTQITR